MSSLFFLSHRKYNQTHCFYFIFKCLSFLEGVIEGTIAATNLMYFTFFSHKVLLWCLCVSFLNKASGRAGVDVIYCVSYPVHLFWSHILCFSIPKKDTRRVHLHLEVSLTWRKLYLLLTLYTLMVFLSSRKYTQLNDSVMGCVYFQ